MGLKIAIMSDSHDNSENVSKIAAIANERNCSYLFHLGDVVSPRTAEKLKTFQGPVKGTFGNCDGDIPGLQRVFNTIGADFAFPPYTLELENKKIVLLHAPFRMDEMIRSQNADYIFYGHMHKQDLRWEGKTLVINPGDSGGWRQKASFAILDVLSGKAELLEI